jgi:hypothetical protein
VDFVSSALAGRNRTKRAPDRTERNATHRDASARGASPTSASYAGTRHARPHIIMNNGNNDTLGGSLNEKVDQIKHRVIDVKDRAVTRSNAFIERATDYIKSNPLKAVAMAFGAGYIGMRIFRR